MMALIDLNQATLSNINQIHLISQFTEVKSIGYKDVSKGDEIIDNLFVMWILKQKKPRELKQIVGLTKSIGVKTEFLQEIEGVCQQKLK